MALANSPIEYYSGTKRTNGTDIYRWSLIAYNNKLVDIPVDVFDDLAAHGYKWAAGVFASSPFNRPIAVLGESLVLSSFKVALDKAVSVAVRAARAYATGDPRVDVPDDCEWLRTVKDGRLHDHLSVMVEYKRSTKGRGLDQIILHLDLIHKSKEYTIVEGMNKIHFWD